MMKYEEAAKILDELKNYRITNDETVMKRYPIYQLREALSLYRNDKEYPHYEDLKHYIQEREDETKRMKELKDKKWWHSPLALCIIAGVFAIVSAVLSSLTTNAFNQYRFNIERQDRIRETAALEAIIQVKNKELANSMSERDKLMAKIDNAVNSGDTSKLTAVISEVNNKTR